MPETKSNGLKYIFLGLIVVAFLCFVMGGVTLRRGIALLKQGTDARQPVAPARPSPFPRSVPQRYPEPVTQPVPQAVPQGSVSQASETMADPIPAPTIFIGEWQGAGIFRPAGITMLKLEIRPRPEDPTRLSGYATFSNIGIEPLPNLGRPGPSPNLETIINQRLPRSLILTGTAAEGGLAFNIDKAIGPQGPCPPTGLSVTQFGSDQLAAEWKSGTGQTCPGGQLMLTRTRK